MSNVLQESVPQEALPSVSDTAVRSRSVPNWLREPLLHFLLLGGLLFAIDHSIASRSDDPHTIVMDAKVNNEIRQLFRSARGQDPDDAELTALRQAWLDNEVLYREGLSMQLDKGDPTVRERVIFKALSVIDANNKLPQYDDKLLQTWFEDHRNKYDEPTRIDFQEAVLTDDQSEAAVRSFVTALNAGIPGETKAGLRIFKGRPEANIIQGYGEDFAKALKQARPNEWVALQAKSGWHVIRPVGVTPGRPANYESLRGVVLQDWTDATMAQQRTDAVRALANKYTVKYEADK